MARAGRRSDQSQRHDRRDLDRQGRCRAAFAGHRDGDGDPGGGGRYCHRRPGDRADRRRGWRWRDIRLRRAADERRGRRARVLGQRRRWRADANDRRARRSTRRKRTGHCRGRQDLPRSGARGGRGGREPGERLGQRTGRAHRQVRRAQRGGRQRRRSGGQRRNRNRDARGRPAAEGRRRGAGQIHGAVALDPDGDEYPNADRDRPGRAPARAEGGRQEGVVHAPDRLRDRQGRYWHAGDGQPLCRDRRQAQPH